MKKLLVIVLAVMTVAAMTVFTACKFTDNKDKNVSASNTGSQQSQSVDPGQSQSTDPGQSQSADPGQSTDPSAKTAHTAPTFDVEGDSVTISQAEGGTVKFKVDNGEWTIGNEAPFAETVGAHTVTAMSTEDDEYAASEEATFTYETETTALSVKKTDTLTGKVSFTGSKLQVLEGNQFVDCATTDYAETASARYTFKAAGGWFEDDAIYYVGETVKTFIFVKTATEEYVVEDFDGVTDSILQEDWEVMAYKQGGDGQYSWQNTTASITVGKTYAGSDCAAFNCWNNGTKFRYSKAYDALDGYNYVSFTVRGDGIAKMELSVKDTETGIYLNKDLGTLASGWYDYKVAMTDSGWKLYYQGAGLDVGMAISYTAESYGVINKYEILPFCDTFSFIVYGNTANGATTKIFLENVRFGYEENVESGVEQPLYAIGNYYVPTSTSENYPTFYIDIASDGKTAAMKTVGLEQNMTIDTDVTISASSVTLTAKQGADALTLKGNFEENGRVVAITNVTGTYAQYVDKTVKYAVAANLSMDFESTPGSGVYASNDWLQEQYVTAWKTITGQMNNRSRYNTKVVNMAVGNGTTGKFTFNKEGNPLGLANYFSVDLGNDFDGAKDIKLQIIVTDTSGKDTWVFGNQGEFGTIPVSTLKTYGVYLDTAVNVQSFRFVIENKSGVNQYLYTDNYVVTYVFEKPEQPEEPEAEVVHTIDFEDGAGSGNYVNASWTQYKWNNSAYEATSAKMNSRSNGSKIVNMYGGWTTYKFIYNENGAVLGKANGFTARVGNYFVEDKAIKIRVALVAEDDSMVYLYGTQSGFYDFAYTGANTMVKVEKTFDEINVKSIIIFVRYESADNYLYVDDITLTYTAPQA